MKSVEFIVIDEGVGGQLWNWAKRRYSPTVAGRRAAQQEWEIAQAEHAKSGEKEFGRKQFLSKLKQSLQSGIKSGSISLTEFENLSQRDFNRLIENAILNETSNIKDYLRRYMDAIVARYEIAPEYKNRLEELITDAAAAIVTANGNLDNPNVVNSTSLLWDWIWTVGSEQIRDPKTGAVIQRAEPESVVGKYPFPDKDYTVTISTKKYQFTSSPSPVWMDVASGSPIKNSADIQRLNKEYWKLSSSQSAQPPSPVTAPSTPTPSTASTAVQTSPSTP